MTDKIQQLLDRKGCRVETVPEDATVCEAVARMNAEPEPHATAGTCPHPYLSEPGVHRSATPDSPCVA